jgi:hypothetical protein
MAMDVMFDAPVLARVRGDDGRSELLEIKSAREGLSALHRRGLGGYQLDDPAWQATADKLIQAALYPSEKRTAEAREALLKIAAEPGSAKLDA